MQRLYITSPRRISSSSASSLIDPAIFTSPSIAEPQFSNSPMVDNPSNDTPKRQALTFPSPENVHRLPTSRYASLLKACIDRKAIKPGKQLHSHLCQIELGFNRHLATKLVNLYCVCGDLADAHNLFDRIPKRNLFLWNVLIRGYAWNGPYEVAISLYHQIFDYGLVPDRFTFPNVLKACSALSAIEEGRRIHKRVIDSRCETNVFVGAALIDMYAKCGYPERARIVFDRIELRDAVLWNSMLAAYAQNGFPNESIALCRNMALTGLSLTEATLATLVSVSADIAAHPLGKELHGFSWRHGFESNDKVKTALVDMYAKSGFVKAARALFERLGEKRVVSWNAMINGYAMHGHAAEALGLFETMRIGAAPDHITFVGVLGACSHAGLLEKGLMFFELMVKEYRIEPTVQHYTCMVHLLGHSGHLDRAYNLITEMKVALDSGVWGALLNSCKIHGKVELAERAVEKLAELEPNDSGHYVILSNIYAQAGKWDGVARMRQLMVDKGIKKSVACSWIEVRNKVHTFLSGDISHPDSDAIYSELERVGGLMAEAGYVPSTGSVFHDVEDDEKTGMVCSHSERLAIAFGLISTEYGARLLVTKNLRICEDCHVAVKFISRITEREITVRDVNRYHHFKDGACSCGDFW